MALVELEAIGFLLAHAPTGVTASSKLGRVGVVECRKGSGGEGDFGTSPGLFGGVHVLEGERCGKVHVELCHGSGVAFGACLNLFHSRNGRLRLCFKTNSYECEPTAEEWQEMANFHGRVVER